MKADIEVCVRSMLRCPRCHAMSDEIMPTDACLIRFDCPCGAILRPKPGDCCVFCSYGSVPCPPIQVARATGLAACCSGSKEPADNTDPDCL